ncbi:MAG: NAD(P)-binding protein, partial [Methanobacterium sp.]
MNKIKISGAGPAGLSAAISLAKDGYEVDVY